MEVLYNMILYKAVADPQGLIFNFFLGGRGKSTKSTKICYKIGET